MKLDGTRSWDFLPAGVAAAACAVAIGYWRIMSAQDDRPRAVFLAGMLLGAVLAGYAAFRSVPFRVQAIATSGLILFAFGLLALFSIGFPMLVAGVFAIAFALEARVLQDDFDRPRG